MGTLLPGLFLALLGAVLAQLLAAGIGPLSSIVVAVALGFFLRNARLLPAAADPGLAFAATSLLRVAIVLLGLRLVVDDLWVVGGQVIAVVVVTVVATLVFTYGLGRLLGLPASLALLTGTGYAICGATAVAAMREVVDADDGAPAFAIALVTMFGTLSIFVLPAAAQLLSLGAVAFGQWAGTAVHDVGQVVATAAFAGEDALTYAVAVKLMRVLLLGPLLLLIGVLWRRRRSTGTSNGLRPVLLPPFVVGFMLAAAIRATGVLPDQVLSTLGAGETWLFTVALLGLGAGVRYADLREVGSRALVLGVLAFLFVAGISLLGVLLVHGPAVGAHL